MRGDGLMKEFIKGKMKGKRRPDRSFMGVIGELLKK